MAHSSLSAEILRWCDSELSNDSRGFARASVARYMACYAGGEILIINGLRNGILVIVCLCHPVDDLEVLTCFVQRSVLIS